MWDYGGDQIAPFGSDRGYAKQIFVGNTTGNRFTSAGERYDEVVETIFGTAGSNNGAIAKCHNADLGTKIFVRRGHAESISAADFGSDQGARKRIHLIGEGDETERPTLTFSATGSTWLLDTDSIIVENFNINLEPGTGGVAVTAALAVTGNGCGFRRCKFRTSTDVNNKCTLPIVWSGVNGFMEDCFLYGATAGESTTVLRLTGADRFRLRRTYIAAATSAVGVGVVQFLTTASTNIDFEDFFFANNKAASTAAVSGLASCSGRAAKGHLHVLANTAGELTTAWGTKASVQFKDVGVTNDVGEVATSLLPLSA